MYTLLIIDNVLLMCFFSFQILLLNPFCIVAYTLASWRFFYERIMVEEITLLNFFGEDYYHYQKKVKTGLPFIEGYRVEL